MKKFFQENLKIIIGFLIGIILLVLWLRFINITEMISYIKEIKLSWVIIAISIYLLSYLVRSIRWQIILSPVAKISIKESFIIYMSGMLVNYLAPIRAGEIAKSFFLKGLKTTPVSRSLPTIFIDKMMDLFPIIILLLLLPFVPIKLNSFLIWGLTIIFTLFIIFLAVIVFSIYKSKSVSNFIKIWFFWLPKKYKTKVDNFIQLFIEGLSVVKKVKKKAGLIFALTILAIVLDAFYIVFMFMAFGYHIAFLIALFGYTLINLSYILPTPPAQIGTNEAIYIIIFTFGFGIDKNMVSATLGFAHLLTGSMIFIVGMISLQWLNISLGRALSLKGK